MKYRVTDTRTTMFVVERADNEHSAIEAALAGNGIELGRVKDQRACPLCPDCESGLTDRTTRLVAHGGTTYEEPTYCDACDREVAVP